MTDVVLVVAAHPDDELLGCGAALARHVAAGARVRVLILAEGARSRGTLGTKEVAELQECAQAAARVVGYEQPEFAGFPDNRMDSVDLLTVIQRVEETVRRTKPTIVYTHHTGDLNVDHRIAHEAVLTACRPMPGSEVRQILAFETVSSTEWGQVAFEPNYFIEVGPYLSIKERALSCYPQEMRAFPHARSIEAVVAKARSRGASIGVDAAEAFVLARQVAKLAGTNQ